MLVTTSNGVLMDATLGKQLRETLIYKGIYKYSVSNKNELKGTVHEDLEKHVAVPYQQRMN